MGRILDLCGEVAAAAEEGPEGLVLPPDVWDRMRDDWTDEEIEDAIQLVHESLLQGELVESTDSLSARLVDLLGAYGDPEAFHRIEAGTASLDLETVGQLVRRVARVEEVLEAFRDTRSPDRRGFDRLQQRLADYGIEREMEDSDPRRAEPTIPVDGEDDEEE